jgi:hypothetical protein
MQDASQDANVQETDSESPAPSSEEGYSISIHVTTQGYEVHGPDPLPAEPQGEQGEESEQLPDLTTAIKHVLAIVKENPIAQDEQEGFKSATQDMGK